MTCQLWRKKAEANPKDRREGRSLKSGLGFGREREEPLWSCAKGCGTCCKLAKGSSFAMPEEIFQDPADVQQFHEWLSSKTRPKPKSPSWSSFQEDDLGQCLEAKLCAADQKRA